MHIPRLDPPPEGHTANGWCLYENDRWDGPAPQEWDERSWLVYPDRVTAFMALARELRKRCELFETGQLPGDQLICTWYPTEVTYPRGNVTPPSAPSPWRGRVCS